MYQYIKQKRVMQFSSPFRDNVDIQIDCDRADKKGCRYAVEDPSKLDPALPQLSAGSVFRSGGVSTDRISDPDESLEVQF
jgi:hypothetical protein